MAAKPEQILRSVEQLWGELPPVDGRSLLDGCYQPEELVYEERDLYDLWGGKDFSSLDCSIVEHGLYFSPYWMLTAEARRYYLGGMARCYLLAYGRGVREVDEQFFWATESAMQPIASDLSNPHERVLHDFLVWAHEAFSIGPAPFQSPQAS